MIGYVVVNKSELKFKEFDQYRRYYCGLCQRLGKRHGRMGQIALSYDMTFLVLLFTGLYEPEEQKGARRCIAHPWKKQELRYNACTDYVVDMTVLFAYYKCIDDDKDEKKWFRKPDSPGAPSYHGISRRVYAHGLGKKVERLEGRYPEKIRKIEDAMDDFSRKEVTFKERLSGKCGGEGKAGDSFPGEGDFADVACLDALADAFGKTLSYVFSFSPSEKDTAFLGSLEKIGYEIGRFIYILDAYDDLDEDRKKKRFNPLFFSELTGESLDGWIEDVLRDIIARAAREFEKLPILKDVGILRNILYSGIWSRFYQVREARGNKRAKQENSGKSAKDRNRQE